MEQQGEDRPRTEEYEGAVRFVCGWLPYLIELGTVLGPKETTGEYVTVVGHWQGGSLVSYTSARDQLPAGGDVRSVAERAQTARRVASGWGACYGYGRPS